jgi:hypothetical protein
MIVDADKALRLWFVHGVLHWVDVRLSNLVYRWIQ